MTVKWNEQSSEHVIKCSHDIELELKEKNEIELKISAAKS